MIKEDQTAYQDWVDTEGKSYNGPHHLPWQAACAYKDKRIAELKKALSQIEVLLEPGSWVFGTSLGNDSKRLYILNLLKRISEGGEG